MPRAVPKETRRDDEMVLTWLAQRRDGLTCVEIAQMSGVLRQRVAADTNNVRKADIIHSEGDVDLHYW